MREASNDRLNVLITSHLEMQLVETIKSVAPKHLNVCYDPSLVQIPRYKSDHNGIEPELSEIDQERWMEWVRSADIMFDIDWMDPQHLIQNAPRLRWVQCTAAGIAEKLARYGLTQADVTFTTCSGVHGVPLAEFVAMSLLYFRKAVPLLQRWKSDRHWEYFANEELTGTRVLVVGLGGIGARIAAYLSKMGLRVWGVRRSTQPAPPGIERVVRADQLLDVLPDVGALVLACPLTNETRGMIGEVELRAMRPSAVLVNVSRGAVIDEGALIRVMKEGQLRGAALDVFEEEPLPASSPLWNLDNVLISPHLAATVGAENERIVELFVDNLGRFLRNEPLRNVFDPGRGY